MPEPTLSLLMPYELKASPAERASVHIMANIKLNKSASFGPFAPAIFAIGKLYHKWKESAIFISEINAGNSLSIDYTGLWNLNTASSAPPPMARALSDTVKQCETSQRGSMSPAFIPRFT